jgi:hypothetical protein
MAEVVGYYADIVRYLIIAFSASSTGVARASLPPFCPFCAGTTSSVDLDEFIPKNESCHFKSSPATLNLAFSALLSNDRHALWRRLLDAGRGQLWRRGPPYAASYVWRRKESQIKRKVVALAV